MHLLKPEQYVRSRQAYCYCATDCSFTIIQTGNLNFTGDFAGIFARDVPRHHPNGINLRHLEVICQEIFHTCSCVAECNNIVTAYLDNLKNIVSAIVYWKMASQGGRARLAVRNVLSKWVENTSKQLINAYRNKKMSQFKIGGIRIPTATAFMRFLFPNDFGIMDSKVIRKYTQPKGITTLSVRKDGYPNDTSENVKKYYTEYVLFLKEEAEWLNKQGVTFEDIDASGKIIKCSFRACDIEMALFSNQ